MDLLRQREVRDWNHQANEMDIWRIAPSGGAPERLTYLNTSVTFLAMLDQDTLAFIAPDQDGAGSWLWSLDVGSLRSQAGGGGQIASFPAGFRRESINTRRCRRAATAGQWSPPEPTLRRAVARADSRRQASR